MSAGIFLDSTGSTNDDAKQRARDGAVHGTFVVADHQTAGRGRSGSAWFSPPRSNLYFSIVLRPSPPVDNVATFALAAGTCVATLVEQAIGKRAGIKWPNDVQVDGRKIAGLLLEASHRAGQLSFVVVGVGLNVATTAFPPELVATSLAIEGAKNVDRRALASELASYVCEAWGRFEREGLSPFLPALSERDVLRGKRVRVEGVSGIASGVDAQGHLLLIEDTTTYAVTAGHVELA